MLHAVAAIAHNAAGDSEAARAEAESGVAIARELRHSSALATALSALGQARLRDDPDARWPRSRRVRRWCDPAPPT